jgi:hypothetical protein
MAEIRSLARKHGPDVIAELARLAKEVQSEQARISRNVLIDRAYGRAQASQLIEIELPDVSKIDGVTTENPKQLDRGVGCSDPRAASFNPENRPKDQSQQKDRYDKRDHSNLL